MDLHGAKPMQNELEVAKVGLLPLHALAFETIGSRFLLNLGMGMGTSPNHGSRRCHGGSTSEPANMHQGGHRMLQILTPKLANQVCTINVRGSQATSETPGSAAPMDTFRLGRSHWCVLQAAYPYPGQDKLQTPNRTVVLFH